jgi:hypothetical protein
VNALATLVSRNQWEPVDDSGLLLLRHWSRRHFEGDDVEIDLTNDVEIDLTRAGLANRHPISTDPPAVTWSAPAVAWRAPAVAWRPPDNAPTPGRG